MNFALCLFNYSPYGGLQRDFLRIAQECVQRGHTVETYTMQWVGERDPLIPVTLLSPKGWQNNTQCYRFGSQLREALSKKSFDLVIGFNKMPGLDIYYAADTCFQATAREKHGVWYRFTPRYQQYVALEKSVFAQHANTTILLLSKHQQTEFMKYYQTDHARFHLLPPGISRDRMAPENASDIRTQERNAWNIAPHDFLLLMIGSGFKTKGLDRILLAIASLPDALKNRTHLFIVGKDHEAPFKRQANHLRIADRVRFLGGRDDIPSLLLASDILLHPAYHENTGTVLLEAVVSGRPVITTEVCGYAHYIQAAQAGIVLPSPFQQIHFNQALKNMLLSPEWMITLQDNALSFAKKADIYHMPERAVDIIESLGHQRAS